MEKFWTAKETQIILDYFGKVPATEISAKHLPNRTTGAIRGKAHRLGLKSNLTTQPTETLQQNGSFSTSDDELLEELGRRGYSSVKREIPKVDEKYELPALLEPIEIGIVSDIQIGNKHQQLTHLNRFYDFCYDRGIQTMLNCGDVVDGNGKVYRGQVYDLFLHGADAQENYTVDAYPKRKGMITYMIGGNHDESFYKSDGNEILRHIADRRDDLLYLGMYGAHLTLGNIKIYMMHSAGGVAYARSYKLQKIIEQMAPQKKPHILFAGHWHVANHLPMYRNVEGFSLGCFQAQTSYH
jgi:predicted phosphodiesterase